MRWFSPGEHQAGTREQAFWKLESTGYDSITWFTHGGTSVWLWHLDTCPSVLSHLSPGSFWESELAWWLGPRTPPCLAFYTSFFLSQSCPHLGGHLTVDSGTLTSAMSLLPLDMHLDMEESRLIGFRVFLLKPLLSAALPLWALPSWVSVGLVPDPCFLSSSSEITAVPPVSEDLVRGISHPGS